MSNNIENKAKKLITGAKDEFKKQIARDKVQDITVTSCTEKDGAYVLTGSAGAKSPTGKLKTYGYTAVVSVDANENCELTELKVNEL